MAGFARGGELLNASAIEKPTECQNPNSPCYFDADVIREVEESRRRFQLYTIGPSFRGVKDVCDFPTEMSSCKITCERWNPMLQDTGSDLNRASELTCDGSHNRTSRMLAVCSA